MDIDPCQYHLRCELRGHEDDVRGICVCGDLGIATSSRDRTVKFWTPDAEGSHRYALSKTLIGHSSFVGPLAWIPPCDHFSEGAIVSGGMDTLVILWDVHTGQAVETMRGHKLQVTGIAVDVNGDIISSSIDCTLRRWKEGQMVDIWEAHRLAVQSVIVLPSGELITGSADATIKLWKGRSCLHTYAGHTDTVRGLAVMPDLGILSASHDFSIRLWSLTGQILLEMIDHSSLVYSVHAHSSGLIASGSEDCFLKIWRDGKCIQSIEHPGCVWDVKFLESGDIVTACSDGAVRIWTSSHNHVPEPLELEAFALELSLHRSKTKKVGGLSLNELPGLEALQIPGTKDGQTKIVREGDNGVAYSWNSGEQTWDKIGEVVDKPEVSRKSQVFDGDQYDYVFDVDLEDGGPLRKLPYNHGDNPYIAADKWLLKENLPVTFQQQVVDFILQNTGQNNFSFDPALRDPYTGSSGYVPEELTTSWKRSPTRPSFKHIPKKGMLFIDAAQFDGILKKIMEINSDFSLSMEEKQLALTELELSRLSVIIKILKDASHYHRSKFADADAALLIKMLKSWPVNLIFPVLDAVRMFVLHPDGAYLLHSKINSGDDVIMETFKKATASPALSANILTIGRIITNLFRHSQFLQWLQMHRIEVLDTLSYHQSSSNKHIHFAYSTILLNYAVLLIELKDHEGQAQVLSAALEVAEDEIYNTDSKFRALVAIGSLMLSGSVKSIATDFDIQSTVNAAKLSKESKIEEICADIELVIKAS